MEILYPFENHWTKVRVGLGSIRGENTKEQDWTGIQEADGKGVRRCWKQEALLRCWDSFEGQRFPNWCSVEHSEL